MTGPVAPGARVATRVAVLGELAKLGVRASGTGPVPERFSDRQLVQLETLVELVWKIVLADAGEDR